MSPCTPGVWLARKVARPPGHRLWDAWASGFAPLDVRVCTAGVVQVRTSAPSGVAGPVHAPGLQDWVSTAPQLLHVPLVQVLIRPAGAGSFPSSDVIDGASVQGQVEWRMAG